MKWGKFITILVSAYMVLGVSVQADDIYENDYSIDHAMNEKIEEVTRGLRKGMYDAMIGALDGINFNTNFQIQSSPAGRSNQSGGDNVQFIRDCATPSSAVPMAAIWANVFTSGLHTFSDAFDTLQQNKTQRHAINKYYDSKTDLGKKYYEISMIMDTPVISDWEAQNLDPESMQYLIAMKGGDYNYSMYKYMLSSGTGASIGGNYSPFAYAISTQAGMSRLGLDNNRSRSSSGTVGTNRGLN